MRDRLLALPRFTVGRILNANGFIARTLVAASVLAPISLNWPVDIIGFDVKKLTLLDGVNHRIIV